MGKGVGVPVSVFTCVWVCDVYEEGAGAGGGLRSMGLCLRHGSSLPVRSSSRKPSLLIHSSSRVLGEFNETPGDS